MVTIRYFAPAPELRGLVSSYYFCETQLGVLTDRLRAELGQVRFILEGSLRCTYDDGRSVECPPCLLTGPTAGPVTTEARGPLAMFGAGLMPSGWSTLIGADADELADDIVDLPGLRTDRGAGVPGHRQCP